MPDKELEDKNEFWKDVSVLTNKFEPLDNFAKEQQLFEQKIKELQANRDYLNKRVKELKID